MTLFNLPSAAWRQYLDAVDTGFDPDIHTEMIAAGLAVNIAGKWNLVSNTEPHEWLYLLSQLQIRSLGYAPMVYSHEITIQEPPSEPMLREIATPEALDAPVDPVIEPESKTVKEPAVEATVEAPETPLELSEVPEQVETPSGYFLDLPEPLEPMRVHLSECMLHGATIKATQELAKVALVAADMKRLTELLTFLRETLSKQTWGDPDVTVGSLVEDSKAIITSSYEPYVDRMQREILAKSGTDKIKDHALTCIKNEVAAGNGKILFDSWVYVKERVENGFIDKAGIVPAWGHEYKRRIALEKEHALRDKGPRVVTHKDVNTILGTFGPAKAVIYPLHLEHLQLWLNSDYYTTQCDRGRIDIGDMVSNILFIKTPLELPMRNLGNSLMNAGDESAFVSDPKLHQRRVVDFIMRVFTAHTKDAVAWLMGYEPYWENHPVYSETFKTFLSKHKEN